MSRPLKIAAFIMLMALAGYASAQAAVTVSVVAAKGEGRGADEVQLGSGLESIRPFLKGLPFKRYSLVKRSNLRAATPSWSNRCARAGTDVSKLRAAS